MKQKDLDLIESWDGLIPTIDIAKFAYLCGRLDSSEEAANRLRDPEDKKTENYLRKFYSGK